MTNEEPIEAWISDSATRLKAIMSTSAIQKFVVESKKRVNKGILGGLIQILDFEVVATHLGPRDSRITLLVKEFKSLGSEGSSTFNVPRPIEVNQEVQKLSERLKGIRAKDYAENRHQKHLDDSERRSTVTSHNDFDLSSDENPMASQEALATQAQFTNHPTKKVGDEPGPPTQKASEPFPAHVTGVESSSPVQKQPNSALDMKTGNYDPVINEKATSGVQKVRHPPETPSGAIVNEVKKPKNVAALLSLVGENLFKFNKSVATTEKSVPERENPKDQENVAEPPNVLGQSNRSSIVVEQGTLVEDKESLLHTERNMSGPASDKHNSVHTGDGPKEFATTDNADPALAQVSS